MTQYVLQVKNDTKQLIKCFTVCEKCPIRPIEEAHSIGRKQIVIEDTDLYNEVVGVYEKHKLKAKFTIDELNNTITWEIE